MPEETKDVNPEDPSTSEQVVNEPEETTPQVESEATVEGQEAEIPSQPQEVKPEVTPQPDRPEINYAMEAARKATEALEIARQLQQQQQQPVQQQPQYTKAQLRAFADQTQDTGQRIWALEEIDKIDKSERQREMRELFETQTRQNEGNLRRQQAYQFVQRTFPQCFIKDAAGNILGFDNTNPLTQKINQYMQQPDIANNPQGLVAAAKMAAFDLGVSMNLQKKVNQTTAQLRREQKKNLITTSGTTPAKETTATAKAKQIQKLVEQYRKTRDPEIFKQLTKLRGLIPQP